MYTQLYINRGVIEGGFTMMFEKTFIGEKNINQFLVKYYVVKRDNIYGVEIEEESSDQLLCDYEYFTHNHCEAFDLATKMNDGLVTLTTMVDILDDYIN